MKSAKSAFNSWEFKEASSRLNKVGDSLDKFDKNLSRYSFLSRVDYFQGITEVHNNLIIISDSIKAVESYTTALIPFEDYIDNYKSNLVLQGSELVNNVKEDETFVKHEDIEENIEREQERMAGVRRCMARRVRTW